MKYLKFNDDRGDIFINPIQITYVQASLNKDETVIVVSSHHAIVVKTKLNVVLAMLGII